MRLPRTLILDEEGLYDPATFNDRLLLGLKGTMSEAELFVLRARLQGGILNKARRGALKLTLPIGLCYTEADAIVLDPDMQVQATIREVFRSFQATGSAEAQVRHFHQQLYWLLGLSVPKPGGEQAYKYHITTYLVSRLHRTVFHAAKRHRQQCEYLCLCED